MAQRSGRRQRSDRGGSNSGRDLSTACQTPPPHPRIPEPSALPHFLFQVLRPALTPDAAASPTAARTPTQSPQTQRTPRATQNPSQTAPARRCSPPSTKAPAPTPPHCSTRSPPPPRRCSIRSIHRSTPASRHPARGKEHTGWTPSRTAPGRAPRRPLHRRSSSASNTSSAGTSPCRYSCPTSSGQCCMIARPIRSPRTHSAARGPPWPAARTRRWQRPRCHRGATSSTAWRRSLEPLFCTTVSETASATHRKRGPRTTPRPKEARSRPEGERSNVVAAAIRRRREAAERRDPHPDARPPDPSGSLVTAGSGIPQFAATRPVDHDVPVALHEE
jgi:hypothetical protein